VTRVLIGAARGVVAIGLYVAAWGWLHLAAGVSVPGPTVSGALPLYEAAGHDSVPVLTVVGVWSATAIAIALALGVRSVAGAITTGLVVAAATLVLQAIQLHITRQTLYGYDWKGAVHSTIPWLAGAACAVAPLLVRAVARIYR
jgi:hypothetical protein